MQPQSGSMRANAVPANIMQPGPAQGLGSPRSIRTAPLEQLTNTHAILLIYTHKFVRLETIYLAHMNCVFICCDDMITFQDIV